MPGGRASIALAATLAVVLAAPATTVAVAPGTNVLISRPLGLGALTTPTTNDSSVTGSGRHGTRLERGGAGGLERGEQPLRRVRLRGRRSFRG